MPKEESKDGKDDATNDTGRVNVDVPKRLHTALRVYCVESGKTMSASVAEAIALLVDKRRTKKKPTT